MQHFEEKTRLAKEMKRETTVKQVKLKNLLTRKPALFFTAVLLWPLVLLGASNVHKITYCLERTDEFTIFLYVNMENKIKAVTKS